MEIILYEFIDISDLSLSEDVSKVNKKFCFVFNVLGKLGSSLIDKVHIRAISLENRNAGTSMKYRKQESVCSTEYLID